MKGAARRLSAILVADIAEFSRHMENDDAGTLARLRDIRREVIDPAIADTAGRIVKTTGDGMLVEFASADAALRCAVDVQRAMDGRNAGAPAAGRLQLRIGINIGDIIVEGDDIFGDGVNVAARLESLAPPGGICVSAAVRDQVHGGLDVDFLDAGEQQVKNIARPIRCFMVGLASGAAPRAQEFDGRTRREPSPRPMSVGVMPFVALSEDASAERRAKSIMRDFTAMLTRCGSLISVVPVAPDARAVGVRYLAEGEVRHEGDATQVDIRLVDASSGEQIWSESTSLPASQNAVANARRLHAVAWKLSRALVTVEIRRVSAQPEAESTPVDYALRALALDRTEPDIRERMRRKEVLIEDALRRDPNSVPALCALANALDLRITRDVDADRDSLVRRMDEVTAKAVRLNEIQPTTWFLRSAALMYAGQWQAALEACAKAIALEPYSAGLLTHRAWLIMMCGRPEEALSVLEEAIAIDPQRSAMQMQVACEARLLLGRYDQAIDAGEKARGLGATDDLDTLLNLTAAYALTDDAAKAESMRDAAQHLVPQYSIAIHRSRRYSRHPLYLELVEQRLYPGLRKAGFAEG
jgi:class 3 adenylate cyclase/tetratricopeptide (TPR) repeat protein